ncbi:MAG: DUF4190 domain-containing protein [Lachnospiraceae bacterium]|nr:DUF4190 domain-containing protein [Lachnospiraceae bacterium]
MNKGKTNFTIQFNAEPETVNNIVQGWLQANKFTWQNKYNEDMYFFNDPVLYGKRGFQYKIENQTLYIYAWTIGLGNKFYMLDSGALNNMPGDSYKNILQSLFNQISAVGGCTQANNAYAPNDNMQANNAYAPNDNMQANNAYAPNDNMQQNNAYAPNNGYGQSVNSGDYAKQFQAKNDAKKEKMCKIGFILSIVGLVLSIFGVIYGVIIYMLVFYLCAQGLKTESRGKAIAGIVLAILSLVIAVIEVMLL